MPILLSSLFGTIKKQKYKESKIKIKKAYYSTKEKQNNFKNQSFQSINYFTDLYRNQYLSLGAGTLDLDLTKNKEKSSKNVGFFKEIAEISPNLGLQFISSELSEDHYNRFSEEIQKSFENNPFIYLNYLAETIGPFGEFGIDFTESLKDIIEQFKNENDGLFDKNKFNDFLHNLIYDANGQLIPEDSQNFGLQGILQKLEKAFKNSDQIFDAFQKLINPSVFFGQFLPTLLSELELYASFSNSFRIALNKINERSKKTIKKLFLDFLDADIANANQLTKEEVLGGYWELIREEKLLLGARLGEKYALKKKIKNKNWEAAVLTFIDKKLNQNRKISFYDLKESLQKQIKAEISKLDPDGKSPEQVKNLLGNFYNLINKEIKIDQIQKIQSNQYQQQFDVFFRFFLEKNNIKKYILPDYYEVNLLRELEIPIFKNSIDLLEYYNLDQNEIREEFLKFIKSNNLSIESFNQKCEKFLIQIIAKKKQEKQKNIFPSSIENKNRGFNLKNKLKNNPIIQNIGNFTLNRLTLPVSLAEKIIRVAYQPNLLNAPQDAADLSRILFQHIKDLTRLGLEIFSKPFIYGLKKIKKVYIKAQPLWRFSQYDESIIKRFNRNSILKKRADILKCSYYEAGKASYLLSFYKNKTQDFYFISLKNIAYLKEIVRSQISLFLKVNYQIDIKDLNFDGVFEDFLKNNLNFKKLKIKYYKVNVDFLKKGVLARELIPQLISSQTVNTVEKSKEIWDKEIDLLSFYKDFLYYEGLNIHFFNKINVKEIIQDFKREKKDKNLTKTAYLQKAKAFFIDQIEIKEKKRASAFGCNFDVFLSNEQRLKAFYLKNCNKKLPIFYFLSSFFYEKIELFFPQTKNWSLKKKEVLRIKCLKLIPKQQVQIFKFTQNNFQQIVKNALEEKVSIPIVGYKNTISKGYFEKKVKKIKNFEKKFSSSRFVAKIKFYQELIKSKEKDKKNLRDFYLKNKKDLIVLFINNSLGMQLDVHTFSVYEQLHILKNEIDLFSSIYSPEKLKELQDKYDLLLNSYPISEATLLRLQQMFAFELHAKVADFFVDTIFDLLGTAFRKIFKLPHTPLTYEEYVLEKFLVFEQEKRRKIKEEKYFFEPNQYKNNHKKWLKKCVEYTDQKLYAEKNIHFEDLDLKKNHSFLRSYYLLIDHHYCILQNAQFNEDHIFSILNEISKVFFKIYDANKSAGHFKSISNEKDIRKIFKEEKERFKKNLITKFQETERENHLGKRVLAFKIQEDISLKELGIDAEMILNDLIVFVKNNKKNIKISNLRASIVQKFKKAYQKHLQSSSFNTKAHFGNIVANNVLLKVERNPFVREVPQAVTKTAARVALVATIDKNPSSIASTAGHFLGTLTTVFSNTLNLFKKKENKNKINANNPFFNPLSLHHKAKMENDAIRSNKLIALSDAPDYSNSFRKTKVFTAQNQGYIFKANEITKVKEHFFKQFFSFTKQFFHIDASESDSLIKYIRKNIDVLYAKKIEVSQEGNFIIKKQFFQVEFKNLLLQKIARDATKEKKTFVNFLLSKIDKTGFEINYKEPKLPSKIGYGFKKNLQNPVKAVKNISSYFLQKKIKNQAYYQETKTAKGLLDALDIPQKILGFIPRKIYQHFHENDLIIILDQVLEQEINLWNPFLDQKNSSKYKNLFAFKSLILKKIIAENNENPFSNKTQLKLFIVKEIENLIGENSLYAKEKKLMEDFLDNGYILNKKNIFTLLPHFFKDYFKNFAKKNANLFVNQVHFFDQENWIEEQRQFILMHIHIKDWQKIKNLDTIDNFLKEMYKNQTKRYDFLNINPDLPTLTAGQAPILNRLNSKTNRVYP